MTIEITIKNNEDPSDTTKELLIEYKDERGNSHFHGRSLKGGEETTLSLYKDNHLELSERFVDRKQGNKMILPRGPRLCG